MQKTFALFAALIVAGALGSGSTNAPRAAPAGASGTAEGLTEGPRLASIYETILRAQFDEARAQLAEACPPAPLAACDSLREVVLWWEIQQDQSSRRLDARFEASAKVAIASATRWTEREPLRGEAWFYLAGAYAPLSEWRVLRGARLAAARDGKRIKDALERALALDGRLQDAWFGIGLYHYYADIAPAALKVLRFFLLLPGGNRVQGLREMERAREQGELLKGEADYQMHWIYLWYEEQSLRALELLRSLDRRYPTNPLFLQRIADVEHVYFHDHLASAGSWRALFDRANAGRVTLATLAQTRARVGLAAELNELSDAEGAIAQLDPVIRTRATEPYGVLALAELTLGDAHASLGHRANAIDAYSRAINDAPRDDPDSVRARARASLARVRSQR